MAEPKDPQELTAEAPRDPETESIASTEPVEAAGEAAPAEGEATPAEGGEPSAPEADKADEAPMPTAAQIARELEDETIPPLPEDASQPDGAAAAPARKGRRVKKKPYTALMAALLVVFLASVGYIVYELADYAKGGADYDEAYEIVTGQTAQSGASQSGTLGQDDGSQWLQPETTTVSTGDHNVDLLMGLDLAALRQVSSAVRGWIYLPDSTISYPLVQGSDNEYYLDHTYRGTNSSIGSIYLDYRVAGDFSDFHTIIYGHRTNNGTMFSCLNSMTKESFLTQHAQLYIRTETGCEVYTIFSAYVGSWTDTGYELSFGDDAAKTQWLADVKALSAVDTGHTPGASDKILTLSTCTGIDKTQRMLVHAYKTGYYDLEEFYAMNEAE